MAKSEELAWAAGLFDGEGTVAIYNVNDGGTWQCYLRLCMLDEECIRRFYEIAGEGRLSKRKKPNSGCRHALWEWRASFIQADRVLEKLSPYLVSKAKQAYLFKKFRELPRGPWTVNNPLKFKIAAEVKADKTKGAA